MKLLTPLLAALAVSVAPLASASVIVTDGEISADNFTFSIPFAATVTGSPEINSGTFVNASPESDSVLFVAVLAASASILYDFDFTASTYRPTDVSIRDRIVLFSLPPTSIATTEWSIDSINWNPIRTVTGTGSGVDSLVTTPISIPGAPDHFYYRVTFENDPGFSSSGYPFQWNRLDNSGDDPTKSFEASFTVVPEPGSILLCIAGAGAMLMRRRR